MHHKDIPHTIDKIVSTIQDAQTKEMYFFFISVLCFFFYFSFSTGNYFSDSFIDSGELKTYKKGLLKMDLVHIQTIIETLRIKKDTKKARDAAALIKVKSFNFAMKYSFSFIILCFVRVFFSVENFKKIIRG